MRINRNFYLIFGVFCFMLASFMVGYNIAPSIKPPVQKPLIAPSAADQVAYVNEVRKEYYLPVLKENKTLDKIAEERACDMKKRNYFDHKDPEGRMPWHLFTENNYTYFYAGENIAEGAIGDNDIMQAYLNSPEHRDNILFKNYTEIGVATCGYYYVQEFGAQK